MNPRNDGLDSKMLTSPMSEGRKTWTGSQHLQCLFLPLGGTPGAIRKRPAKNVPIKQFQVACRFFGLDQASSSLWSKTYQVTSGGMQRKPEASRVLKIQRLSIPDLPVPYIFGTNLPVADRSGNWTPGSKYIRNWKMRVCFVYLIHASFTW